VPTPPPAAPGPDAFELPLTLLVASDSLMTVWRTYAPNAPRTIAVGDTDVQALVDAIQSNQPSQVILEKSFASSGRGAPLMTVLYAERRARGTQIRLFTQESLRALSVSHPGNSSPQTWLTSFAEPLPSRPAQRAPRVLVPPGHRILIDGRPELLVDVSVMGAQIKGSGVLRPGQHVRVTPDPDDPVTVAGVVVWSSFEPSPVPCYRAGVAFSSAVRLEHFLHPSLADLESIDSAPPLFQDLEVCGMCRSLSPGRRMATFMGRRICFNCAATCYEDTD
jgi:hypothetical protein